jgi:hypothetical protein
VFWFLLLAHFLADYPLQTSWIVVNKDRSGVLVLHVFIHFLVSLIFVLIYVREVWPFVILLAVIHFLIDTGKNYFNKTRPNWVVAPYFIDQSIHLVSLIFVAVLMGNYSGNPPFALKPIWLIALIAYLVVTYVWYISERIIAFHNTAYFQQVVDKEWSRMLARAVYLSLSLVFWFSFSNTSIVMLSVFRFPYKLQKFGIRALLTDLAVALAGAIFILRIV